MELICIDRVAFTVFGVDVYWYGVIMSSAILIAYFLSLYLSKIKKYDSNFNFELLIAVVPLGILFARLFAVLFDGSLSLSDYFDFRSGGMSIIGALCGGVIGLILLRLIRKRSILVSADLIVVVLILAQAIGRWGNFFNTEIYGKPIINEAWQIFPFAVEVNGEFFEALFFYESILNLIGFVILICIYWFVKQKGLAVGGYLVYYGIVRFFLEPRRQADYILKAGTIQISRLMSLIMFLIGIAILIYVIVKKYTRNKKKEQISEK